MRSAGGVRGSSLLALTLLAMPTIAQPVARSELQAEEARRLAAARGAELHDYALVEGFALRERQRRLRRLESAIAGQLGPVARERGRLLRALELELSEHALIDPYQYIVDFRDGSNRVEVPASPTLDLVDSYTVSLWLHMEGGARAWETKLFSHSDVNDNKFNVMLEGRHVELLLWGDNDEAIRFRSDDELPLRRWLHLVVDYQRGRGARCLLDGEPMAFRQNLGDRSYPRLRSDPGQELYFGCLDRCVPGSLDDVRVYDRVLELDEIRALGAGLDVRLGLVAHWPLDELSGEIAHNLVARSPHGRVGSSVRRGVAGSPRLEGTGYGFSGKAQQWALRMERIESAIDSLDLLLLEHDTRTVETPSALPEAPHPLVIYPPGLERAWLVLPGRGEPIEVALAKGALPRWQEELASRGRRHDDRAWRESARALCVALWEPVARKLEEESAPDSEIWLSLPQELRSLPFSALVDARGDYLQQTIAFARVGPLLAMRAAPITPAGEVVLIGNPNFRAPRERSTPTPRDAEGGVGEGLPRAARCWVTGPLLYGTRLELQRLGELFTARRAARLEWFDAYVAILEQRLPGAGIVHLATHGYRLDVDCAPQLPLEALEWSGLKLGGSDFLRGDDARHEDRGHLSAAGFSRLDLRKTQLIFFSGCETAGHSDASLARAAWLGGARCSVGTLSAIDDGLTPVLAERFHAQWLAGDTPAQALRVAREHLRLHLLATRGRAHPSTWAPFVLEGL